MPRVNALVLDSHVGNSPAPSGQVSLGATFSLLGSTLQGEVEKKGYRTRASNKQLGVVVLMAALLSVSVTVDGRECIDEPDWLCPGNSPGMSLVKEDCSVTIQCIYPIACSVEYYTDGGSYRSMCTSSKDQHRFNPPSV